MWHVPFALVGTKFAEDDRSNTSTATESFSSQLWLTNSIQRSLLQKAIVAKLVKTFHAFYGNRKLITVFTGPDP